MEESTKKVIENLKLEDVKAYLEKNGPITDEKEAIMAIIINPIAYAIIDEKLQNDQEIAIYWYPSSINVNSFNKKSSNESSTTMPYWSTAIVKPFNAFLKSLYINNYNLVINVQTIFNGELENSPFRLDYQRILTELVKKSKVENKMEENITTYVINRNLIFDLVDQMHKSDNKVR